MATVWMFVVFIYAGTTWNPYLADQQSCEALRQSIEKAGHRPTPCVQVTIKTRQ